MRTALLQTASVGREPAHKPTFQLIQTPRYYSEGQSGPLQSVCQRASGFLSLFSGEARCHIQAP